METRRLVRRVVGLQPGSDLSKPWHNLFYDRNERVATMMRRSNLQIRSQEFDIPAIIA
jgi:hypothetical protein